MEQINEIHRNQMLQSYNMIFVMEVLDKLNDVTDSMLIIQVKCNTLVSWKLP